MKQFVEIISPQYNYLLMAIGNGPLYTIFDHSPLTQAFMVTRSNPNPYKNRHRTQDLEYVGSRASWVDGAPEPIPRILCCCVGLLCGSVAQGLGPWRSWTGPKYWPSLL